MHRESGAGSIFWLFVCSLGKEAEVVLCDQVQYLGLNCDCPDS